MITEPFYAYIDESGSISSNILVVCGVVTDESKILEKRMKAAERKNARNNGEIKASKQSSATRRRIFSNIIDSEFHIYSIVFDLKTITNKPYDFEEVYNFGMGLLCKEIYKDHPQIVFVVDKRYTNVYLRLQLNKNIADVINRSIQKNNTFEIQHEDSMSNALLRVADFAAYETYQDYKNQSPLYEMLTPRVRRRILYSGISWNKIKKESRTP